MGFRKLVRAVEPADTQKQQNIYLLSIGIGQNIQYQRIFLIANKRKLFRNMKKIISAVHKQFINVIIGIRGLRSTF